MGKKQNNAVYITIVHSYILHGDRDAIVFEIGTMDKNRSQGSWTCFSTYWKERYRVQLESPISFQMKIKMNLNQRRISIYMKNDITGKLVVVIETKKKKVYKIL